MFKKQEGPASLEHHAQDGERCEMRLVTKAGMAAVNKITRTFGDYKGIHSLIKRLKNVSRSVVKAIHSKTFIRKKSIQLEFNWKYQCE